MMDLKSRINLVANQEATLQFDTFSIEMAHEIGIAIAQKAKAGRQPVAIDITRNGHQLFHMALEGSTADNDAWIQRKMVVVNRFSHSSYYMSLELEMRSSTMEESYLLDGFTFAPYGGSFPIIIKDTGVIGTITVSGLPQEEDHQLVVDVLAAYLDQ